MTSLTPITDQTFQERVIETDEIVLVDNWAPWCGPCRQVAPILEKLSVEFEGRIRFYSLNVDENVNVPSTYKVSGIPTMLVFSGGELVDTIVGARPEASLRESLTRVLQSS